MQRLLLFGTSGLIAGILTVAISGNWWPWMTISYQYSGVLFACTITALTAVNSLTLWKWTAALRYFSAAFVLAVAAPCGFLLAAVAARSLDVAFNQAAGVILEFIVPACVALIFWALCLTIWLALITMEWRITWWLQAMLVVVGIFAALAATDILAKNLWNRSVFITPFIILEQVGSAVFLAFRTSPKPVGAVISA